MPSNKEIEMEHRRNILPGLEYDKYFPKADGKNGIVKRNGSVKDTVPLMGQIVLSTLNDTKKIAKILEGNNQNESCSNLWHFVHTYIQYELDKEGVEQLRRPARLFQDRKGDCDCMSIFCSSVLYNLGIKDHFFRITKYDKGWQHVYVVVPTGQIKGNGEADYITIDCVLDKYNYEKPYTDKFDFSMKTQQLAGSPIEYLSGIEIEEDFIGLPINDGVELLGDNPSEQQILDAQKQHLIQTRAELIKNPTRYILSVGNPKAYIQIIDYVLENWNDPIKRKKALDRAAESEDDLMTILEGYDNPDEINDDFINGTEDDELLGRKTARKAARKAAKKVAKAAKKSARVLKKTTKRSAKVAKKIAKAKDKATKKVAKSAGKMAKKVAKKAIKAVKKRKKDTGVNPTNEEVEQITNQIVEEQTVTPAMVDEYVEPTDTTPVMEDSIEEEIPAEETSSEEAQVEEEPVEEGSSEEEDIEEQDIEDGVTDGLGDVYGFDDEEVLGRITSKERRIRINSGKRHRFPTPLNPGMRGEEDLLGKKTKAQKAAKKQTRKAKKAKRKAEGKGLFRKIGKGLTKGLKRSNPVLMLARKGMAMALALNIFGLASRLSKNSAAYAKAKENYVKKMGGTAKRFDIAFNRGKGKKQLLGEYDDLLGNNYNENDLLGAAFLVALIPAAVPIANALMNLNKSGDKGSKEEQEALKGFGLGADEDVKEDIVKKVVNLITGIFKKHEKTISADPDAIVADDEATESTDKSSEGDGKEEDTEGDKGDKGGTKITKVPKWLLPTGIVAGSLGLMFLIGKNK